MSILYAYFCLRAQRKENKNFKFADGLFSHTLTAITNEEFLSKARGTSCDFTRRRKFSLKDLTLTLLGFTRAGVKVELDRFFKFLSQERPQVITYTPSAFSQARKKLHENAFIYLRDLQLAYFNTNALVKRYWNEYRVIAIDGSSLNLPNEPCLTTYFGSNKNQNAQVSTGAKISVAYDVCNHLVLDASIERIDKSEHSIAIAHLNKLNPHTDILVFDRGYPSISLALNLHQQGFKFCFRLSTAWKEAYGLLIGKQDVDWILKKGRRYKIGNGREAYLTEDVNGFRLVRIKLANGHTEVLFTNLSDRSLFTIPSLKELYKMRWSVEECYKRLKQIGQIEYFSGRTVVAIKQDFFARIVMLNMSAMIETQCVQPNLNIKEKLKNRNRKYQLQANKTQIWAKIKDFMYEIFWTINRKHSIHKMLQLMLECYDIVRPNRSFNRNIGYRYKRKPLMYKAF